MNRPGPDYDVPEDLRFSYAQIREAGGLVCERRLETEPFRDELEPPGRLLALHVKLQFAVGTNNIYVEGKLSGRIKWSCSRCNRDFEQDFSQPFEELYPAGTELIDIMAQVRQALVLENDISHLCAEECKGLCPLCGCDLNERKCSCDRTPKLSPFGILKDKFSRKKD